MTRSEHRDASHLEDDSDIRNIIQSARMLPISELEQTVQGQLAPLDEPQQLWARPGWSQFSTVAKDTGTETVSKKRKIDDISLEPSAEVDDPVRPRKKAAMRTLAFVDCAQAETSDHQTVNEAQISMREDGGSRAPEPAAITRVANSSPVTPILDDPSIPTEGASATSMEEGCTQPSMLPMLRPPANIQARRDTRPVQRISIPSLLDHERPDRRGHETEQRELLNEILKRL